MKHVKTLKISLGVYSHVTESVYNMRLKAYLDATLYILLSNYNIYNEKNSD